MYTTSIRYEIKCTDGIWRFIFCRAMNGGYDFKTNSAIITTDVRARAFTAYNTESVAGDVKYFEEHSHGLPVRVAQ